MKTKCTMLNIGIPWKEYRYNLQKRDMEYGEVKSKRKVLKI
jgi:hypothetical protein